MRSIVVSPSATRPATTNDAEAHRVSIFSPAGSALLGLSAGQSIDWKASDGKEIRLKVIEVTWQPEANGQFEL